MAAVTLTMVGTITDSPKCPHPSKTCDYVSLQSKNDFADKMKFFKIYFLNCLIST
jgi:hypothetical protein